MTLKQRLADLMPHFDDDGKLLPNKKMTVKQNPLGGFRASTLCDFEHVVANVISGNEYRIEDLPKRPREVWVHYENCGIPVCCSERHGKAIRFIEDTPREVTDADAEYYWDYYKPSSDETIKQAFKRMLQHYENERGK